MTENQKRMEKFKKQRRMTDIIVITLSVATLIILVGIALSRF